jgi:metallo-beta-lactamase family protein
MKISFLGGAGTVTGSKYLVDIYHKKILIDCGLFQGKKEFRDRNWDKFSIDPASIDAVILTHAHLDHSGYLPVLVRNGFKGHIYATSATLELCKLLLPDSGHIQEEEAYLANKYHYSKNHSPALPLYTQKEAEAVLSQFITVNFDQPIDLFTDCHFIFSRSAHILGSAFIQLSHQGSTLLFSGDLGRMHDPIMREPVFFKSADYLILESTYGDRLHEPEDPESLLAEVVNDTAARGGILLMPSFAVGRSQNILYYLAELKAKNKIPNLPVYLDSPMAENATDIYTDHTDEHRLNCEHCSTLDLAANYVESIQDSRKLHSLRFPSIIISASGMLTGGRVLGHIKAFAPHQKNTILFTGYQAEGTLGEMISSGAHEVSIHGQKVSIRAKIKTLGTLSAHADYSEILKWLNHFEVAPRAVFITHGTPESAAALKQKIEEKFGWKCIVPEYLQDIDLSYF